MAFTVTDATQNRLQETVKEPQLVFEIDGVETRYGSDRILKLIRIGDTDPDLLIDGTWVIGGYRELEDQDDYITLDGTSTMLRQQLRPDKGEGSSITSLEISLIDKNDEITNLISPGKVVTDILGRKAKIWFGFTSGVSYPEDFVIIFRGIISDVISDQGVVRFTVAHPESKKRVSIFDSFETILDESPGGIDDSTTSITLDDVSGFFPPINGPSGSPDSGYSSYIRIDDEVIEYTSFSGSSLVGASRGSLGTIAAAHDDEADVSSIYRFEDDAMDLSLKLMLSGLGDYYTTGVEVTNFEYISSTESVSNAIFFNGIDVERIYGVTTGDYITTVSASNGANNVSLKTISDVVNIDTGSYIVIDGVTFVSEVDSTATISFRSQYDVYPDGCKMHPDEVDVKQHLDRQRYFLSSFNYDLRISETIADAKSFIEGQIYLPAGAYSLPRKGRSSMQYHIGPIPGVESVILKEENIINPDNIALRRSINRHFFNTIIYKYEPDILEEVPRRGVIVQSAESFTRTPIGNKPLIIKADGMRGGLASGLATSAANRRLSRYKFGAEHLNKLEVNFEIGFKIEVGDIVIFDPTNLNVSNTADGTRAKDEKLFEVLNKSLNLKTGKVLLDLVDTAFSLTVRYCLIGNSSNIKFGTSTTKFVIEESGASVHGINEYRKWESYENFKVVVRSPDSSTRYGTSTVVQVTSNEITLQTALGFTPVAGDIMELAAYTDQPEQIKLIYGFMSDAAFGDSGLQYAML